MANHASALKAHRQSIKRNAKNSSQRSSLRTALKKFSQLIKDGKTEEAQKSVTRMYSIVDKAVRKKVLSRNAAARQKSRLTKHLNAASAPKQA